MRKTIFHLLPILHVAVLIWFWQQSSYPLFALGDAGWLLAIGRLFGLLAVTCILFQFLLMSRTPHLERVFGLDGLTRLHHVNGKLAILFIIAHPIFVTLSYANSSSSGFFEKLSSFLTQSNDLLKAAIAFGIFLLIVGLSITIVRRRLTYETWHVVHLLTYIAVLLAWAHQLKFGGDFQSSRFFTGYWYAIYAFVFANVILFRFSQPLFQFFRFRFAVERMEQETRDTTSVYITGRDLNRFHSRPGQFLILRFLAKTFWRQAHPFSLSYVPKDGCVRVTIKNSGDFTARIPSLTNGTPVLIEGPYGVFTARPDGKTKFLFIAGGVGITPIRALIESLVPTNDVALLYGSKTSADIIFKRELFELASRVPFRIHHILSDEPAYPGETGKIDREKMMRLVSDILQREIYLCGPPPMMDGVIATLKELGVKPDRIHAEKFSL